MVNRLTLPLADWVGVASLAAASDAQLLHRFVRMVEQQAFAMLVKRHGPMVWGVSRRLLRSHQDAEDAFQACFLVLARKAASLRQPQLLTNWLHGVAHRTALHLRSRQKYAVPLEAEHEPADEGHDQLAWRDCGTRIDQAIEELPTSLRIVFLLCQAEGLSTLATSRRLNLPEGTVVSRLHRARKQLQNLLARYGITSAAGAVVAGWSLALPESLSALTVRSLLGSAPSALVAGLAQGVLTTMMWIKVTTAAVIVSTVGLVGAGAATMIAQGAGGAVAQQVGITFPQSKKVPQEDRIKQLEAQLMEAKDREMMMSQKLEAQMKQTEAVQQFLEKNVLAVEKQSKADRNELARQEESRVKKEVERQRLFMEQTREHQRRRTADLMQAKEQLAKEMEQLQLEHEAIERKYLSVLAEQQEFERKIEQLQQDMTREVRMAEQRNGSDSDKLKELQAKRDAMVDGHKKQQSMINPSSTIVTSMSRLKSQLKLREKLLLEVEEKLLRMQLKLDEK